MQLIGSPIAAFVFSFLLTAAITPGVILLARRLHWVAAPKADRWHKNPTALMGGIAIFLATMTSWWLCGQWQGVSAIALPATGVFVLGFVDDRVNLRPHYKFIGQVVAAAGLIMLGLKFESVPPIVSVPLTLVWVIGISNAVNLLDNMDGLSAGVSMVSALSMAAYCLFGGAPESALALLALAGACGGFLLYNFNPARIFMGDCGSLFLGFSLAALSLSASGTHRTAQSLVLSMLVPVVVLAIPIFDTALVSVARTLNGRSIAQGGRDHSSHRLVALGLSERGTVIALYVLTATFGALAVLTNHLPLLVVLLLAALLFTGLLGLGLYLGFLKVYSEEDRKPSRVRLIGGSLLYKRQLFQVLLDIHLIPMAFVGAHLLRYEGDLPLAVMQAIPGWLPLAFATKLVGLAVCRAYRGVWRYAGMADALTATCGSAVGTLLYYLLFGALTGFQGVSHSVILIDWLLFTMLAVAARTGYVALRHVFGLLPARNGPRILVLGTGPQAQALIHRLRDPFSKDRATIVGILDDSLESRGRTLNGVPILGTISELPVLMEAHQVNRCLLGVPVYTDAAQEILEFCQDIAVTVHIDVDTPPLSADTPWLVAARA